jgi:hypothetical protein
MCRSPCATSGLPAALRRDIILKFTVLLAEKQMMSEFIYGLNGPSSFQKSNITYQFEYLHGNPPFNEIQFDFTFLF